MKRLFIPLKRQFFEAFEQGDKDIEFRRYGPRWNEKTCPIGRPVALSLGYGRRRRLMGKIVGFKAQWVNNPDWIACYGEPGLAAAIKIRVIRRKGCRK